MLVVARASFGGTQRRVGFADLDEFVRGVGIVGVEVGMVGFGEFVELSDKTKVRDIGLEREYVPVRKCFTHTEEWEILFDFGGRCGRRHF